MTPLVGRGHSKRVTTMRDGLYKVAFQTQLGSGAGVIHLIGGRVWGGDAGLYYVGTFTQDGDRFTATVRTDKHTADPTIQSVFGIDRANIMLSGNTSGDSGQLTGTAAEAPGVTFRATLTRLAD